MQAHPGGSVHVAAEAYKIMLVTGKGSRGGGTLGFYEKPDFGDDQKHGLVLRENPQRQG